MARFEYKDGCIRCNECGRLSEPPAPDGAETFGCPCGNAETLDAIEHLIEVYNARDVEPGADPVPQVLPRKPGA